MVHNQATFTEQQQKKKFFQDKRNFINYDNCKQHQLNRRHNFQQSNQPKLINQYFFNSSNSVFIITSSIFMMTRRVDEWITFSKKSNKNLVFYEDKVLDLSAFMNQHPGGKKALMNYINKDITAILFTVFPHKRQPTLNTLMKLTIGRIPLQEIKINQRLQKSKSPTPIKDKKKVCFQSGLLLNEADQGVKNTTKLKAHKSTKEIKSSQASKQKKKKENRQRSKSKDRLSKKQREKASRQQALASKGSSHSINSDMDEEKPIFKVPILYTKNMFST